MEIPIFFIDTYNTFEPDLLIEDNLVVYRFF